MARHRPLESKRNRNLRQRPNGRPLFDIHPLEARVFLSGGGQLAGSVSTPTTTTNLTAQGTFDWSHWGWRTH